MLPAQPWGRPALAVCGTASRARATRCGSHAALKCLLLAHLRSHGRPPAGPLTGAKPVMPQAASSIRIRRTRPRREARGAANRSLSRSSAGSFAMPASPARRPPRAMPATCHAPRRAPPPRQDRCRGVVAGGAGIKPARRSIASRLTPAIGRDALDVPCCCAGPMPVVRRGGRWRGSDRSGTSSFVIPESDSHA